MFHLHNKEKKKIKIFNLLAFFCFVQKLKTQLVLNSAWLNGEKTKHKVILNPQTEKNFCTTTHQIPQEVLHKTLARSYSNCIPCIFTGKHFLDLCKKVHFSAIIYTSNFQAFWCTPAPHSASTLPLPLGMHSMWVAGVTPKFREGIFFQKFSRLKSKLLNCGFHFQWNAMPAQILTSLRQIRHPRELHREQ